MRSVGGRAELVGWQGRDWFGFLVSSPLVFIRPASKTVRKERTANECGKEEQTSPVVEIRSTEKLDRQPNTIR